MRQPNPTIKKPGFYTLASIAIFVGGIYVAQDVLIPLALAVLTAFLLAPMVGRLERLGLGRVVSTLIVVLGSLALVGSFGWFMEQRFVTIVNEIPHYRQSIQSKFHRITQSSGVVEQVREQITETVADATGAATKPATQPVNLASRAVASGGGNGASPLAYTPPSADEPWPVRIYPEPSSPIELGLVYLGKLVTPLLTALIVVVFAIFMLIGREDLRDRIFYLVGRGRLHATTEALDDAATRVSRYLVAQSIINLLFGVFVAIGLLVINFTIGEGKAGVGNILLAGAICGVLRFIPYVGTWIGAILPLGFAFAAYPGYANFIVAMLLFVGVELVTSQAIEPSFLGSSTGISPIAILVATVFWAWLWGPIGLLLSTPLTVLLVVMGKHAPQFEFLDILLSDRPIMDPPMRMYQRLIAGCDQDAIDLGLGFLKQMPLEKVYDEILLPGLAAAERDWQEEKIDDGDHTTLMGGYRELAQTLNDEQQKQDDHASAKAKKHADAGDKPQSAEETEEGPRHLRDGAVVHVLCFPAQGEADEIAGMMLGKLLARRGYQVSSVSADSLASEMVDRIEEHKPHAVVISALPPKAAAHARYLLKRLLGRHGDLKVVLGLWMDNRNLQDISEGGADAVKPVKSLSDAQAQLDQLSHQIFIDADNQMQAAASVAVGK